MRIKTYSTLFFSVLIVSLTACTGGRANVATPLIPTEAVQAPTATDADIEPTSVADAPAPTQTAGPTPIPPTPDPAELPHPLMIDIIRQQEFPGSDLVFEETLEPGLNYDRYIVSYLSEGYKQFALLTVPQGEVPETGWPVIIFNHGYIPPEIYRTTERYIAYVDGFARHQYIVMRPDYRGHGFSEGAATGGYSTPAYTIDVLNALETIKRYPDADPNRIGMWGHSMGGHITLRSMVVRDDIKAGVIWAGVVVSYPDLISLWRRGNGPTPTPDPNSNRGRWRISLIEQYGYPEENPEFWASISSNSYLDDLSGPIQLHHTTGDATVPYIFSEILADEMTQAGQFVDLNIYDGDDHNISQNFNTAMERSLFFFDEYVKQAE